MRHHYWTCSRFADYLRGTKKPSSATGAGWANWRMVAKAAHPVRFWIADIALDKLQKFVYYIPEKIHDVKCYLDNRFVSKTHALVAHKSHLKRGQWRDVDNRILPCLFDTLVDFVETELAAEIFWHNEDYKVPFRYKLPFMHWRSREAGIENLKWQMALIYDENSGIDKTNPKYGKPTDQAERATWILSAYLWWKDIYPNRPDPYDISGWSAYCEESRESSPYKDFMVMLDRQNESKELREKGRKARKLLTKIEKQYEKEDTDMMIKLIKVRHSLWT